MAVHCALSVSPLVFNHYTDWMRFKIPSAAAELLADPCEPETPPGMREFQSSHVLNDQASSFRAFIENMRHLFNHEEDDGLVLLLSMDENSGNLTMGIARQKRRREEGEESTCDVQLQRYLEESQHKQDAVIREYAYRLGVARRRKAYYSQAVEMYQRNSLSQLLSNTLMSLVAPPQPQQPSEAKVRPLSEDTNCSGEPAEGAEGGQGAEELPFCMLE